MRSLKIALLTLGCLVPFVGSADAQQINGCVDSKGKLTIVPTAACPSGETLLTWNIVGPQGPVGAQGPQGVAGTTGPQGPAGLNGVIMSGQYQCEPNQTILPAGAAVMFNLISGGQGIGITGNDTTSFVLQPGVYSFTVGGPFGGGFGWVFTGSGPNVNVQPVLNGQVITLYGSLATVTALNSTLQFINESINPGSLNGNAPCNLSITKLQ